MSTSSIDSGLGKAASRRACRRKLQSLGVCERQATQMAADEFADGGQQPVCRAASDDQRVFPHKDGWLVTRDFDAHAARLFGDRADAERYARRLARHGGGNGILFYDEDGCAMVYVNFPNWRQDRRARPFDRSLEQSLKSLNTGRRSVLRRP